MDRLGPPTMCFAVFLLLALFPAVLLVGSTYFSSPAMLPWSVYVGYVVFGAAMAGVSVAWSLGPVFFAGKRDASPYSGAHVTITGIRGSFGPILGALGVSYLGFIPVFAVSLGLFIISALGMAVVAKRASS